MTRPRSPLRPHLMHFFVTGGTGFIGTHFCRRVLAEGHQVTALVRSPHKIAEDLRGKMEIVPGDLSKFDDPEFTLPPVDIVVHLAGVVAGKNLREYGEVNFAAVKSLLAWLGRQDWAPKRLLFSSSLAAVGPSPGRPLTEADTPAPIDPYGQSKLDAERLMADQPFPTTSFRPCIVLGPGDGASLTLYKMAQSGVAALPGFKEQAISIIDVAELVGGMMAMAHDTSDAHRVYFAASDIQVNSSDLLRAIAKALGKKIRILRLPKGLVYLAMLGSTAAAKVFRFTNQLDAKQYKQMIAPEFVCSSELLQDELGWKPIKSLEATLADAIAGYRATGDLKA